MAATRLDEATGDLPPSDSEPDLSASSRTDKTLTVVRNWVRAWSDGAGLSLELRSWHLQFGNLSIDLDGRLWRRRVPPPTELQLVVPAGERRGFIHRYHDSIFAEHLDVSRTVCRLLDQLYWPGLREHVHSYLASCPVCGAEVSVPSPCLWDMFLLVTDGAGSLWTF